MASATFFGDTESRAFMLFTHTARTTRHALYFIRWFGIWNRFAYNYFLQYLKCHLKIGSYINKVVFVQLTLIVCGSCISLVALNNLSIRFWSAVLYFWVRISMKIEIMGFLVSACPSADTSFVTVTRFPFYNYFVLVFSFSLHLCSNWNRGVCYWFYWLLASRSEPMSKRITAKTRNPRRTVRVRWRRNVAFTFTSAVLIQCSYTIQVQSSYTMGRLRSFIMRQLCTPRRLMYIIRLSSIRRRLSTTRQSSTTHRFSIRHPMSTMRRFFTRRHS